MTASSRRIRFLLLGLYCLSVQCLVSCKERAENTHIPRISEPLADASTPALNKEPARSVASKDCATEYADLSDELKEALRAAGHDDFVGDMCAERAAVAAADVASCSKLPTERWREHCVRLIATKLKRPELCPWVRDSDPSRGRDPLCVALASGRSTLCASVAGSEDRAHCDKQLPSSSALRDWHADITVDGQTVHSNADAARGIALEQIGSDKRLRLGDTDDTTLVPVSPLATARLALQANKDAVTAFVWRMPGAAVLQGAGSDLELRVTEFVVPNKRGDTVKLKAAGVVHVGKRNVEVTLDVRSYLRDLVETPKGAR